MLRYRGEQLPPEPKIAVIANDAIGNFVISTPVLASLKKKWPQGHITYFGGPRTREFEEASALIDARFDAPREADQAFETSPIFANQFHLVVNFEHSVWAMKWCRVVANDDGFVVGQCEEVGYSSDELDQLAQDPEWISPDLAHRYPMLRSGFISEIFLRLCGLDGDLPTYQVPCETPNEYVPDVLVAIGASKPEKLWPVEKWQAALRFLQKQGVSIGMVGAPPQIHGKQWHGTDDEAELIKRLCLEDLRGVWTLPEVAGACRQARLVFSLDNGIMHVAAGVRTPAVALFRNGIHRLWIPPDSSVIPVVAVEGTSVADIPVEVVTATLEKCLG